MRFTFILAAAFMASSLAVAQNRTVTDSTGQRVSIPANPQRVVALHEPLLAVPLIELGVNVVGAYGRSDDGGTLMVADFIKSVLGPKAIEKGITGIGPLGNINLEKVRALKPDLIVGSELDVRNIPIMSPIAPVYLQNSGANTMRGFEAQAALAKVLQRDQAFAQLKSAYDKRVAQVKTVLPKTDKDRTYLAVTIGDQISVMGEMSGAIQAIEDLGYQRIRFSGDQERNFKKSTLVQPISPEIFGRLNPDIVIIMNNFTGTDRSEKAIRTDLDRVVPGWERFLKPAREGRILYLDAATVTTPSVASAQHTLNAVDAWARAKAP